MPDETPPTKPPVAEPLLPQAWGVPQAFRDRLGDEAGRQRLMAEEGHLLLVLHQPPEGRERRRGGRLYWRNAEGEWRPHALKHGDHPVAELLVEYEGVLDRLESAEDNAESARQYFEVLTALNPVVRAAHNIHAVVEEARQTARGDRGLILVRDRAYALTRRADLLQQDAKSTLDFVIARRAEQQAEAARRQAKAAHRLNVLAAVFFPVATLTSVLGTPLAAGVGWLNGIETPGPLVAVLGVGLALGGLLAAFVTRK